MNKKGNLRIMLISPPIITPIEEDVPKNSQIPIGLAYIAAVLEKEGYDNIRALDAFTLEDEGILADGLKKYHGLSAKSIKREIENFQPEIVGISSMYTMYAKGIHIVAEIVKNINKNILVVCGGTHATVNPQMLMPDKNIDIVVKGEGELIFLDIVRAVESNQDPLGLEGIIYKIDGKVIENPSRALIKDLDSLPFPARHFFPIDKYFTNIIKGRTYNIRHPSTTVVTSRGCPGKCIYCCVKRIWGRTWRARSPENIVDEIEFLIKKYGIKEIHFVDDCISVDKGRLYGICEEILRRKIDIKWTTTAGIAIWQLNKDLLRIMKKSGCYRLTFGLESGDPQTLKFIGKEYSYDHVKEIIKEANRLGLWIAATFIIGFPHETKPQIYKTVSYAIKSNLDFIVFYTPVIFAGTDLFDEFIKAGIAYDPEITGTGRAYSTKYVTEEDLLKIRQDANSRFLSNKLMKPWKVVRKIRNKEDLLYFIKLASNVLKSYFSSTCDKKTAFGMLRESRVKND